MSKRAMLAAFLLCVGTSFVAPSAHASILPLNTTGVSRHATPQGGPALSFVERLREWIFSYFED